MAVIPYTKQFKIMAPELSLTDCDKEQIHLIRQIQPDGALLAVDETETIVYAALAPQFGYSGAEVLGKSLTWLMESDAKRLLTGLSDRIDPTVPLLFRSKTWKSWLTCVAHRQGALRILELEFLPPKEVEIPSVRFVRDKREPLYTYLTYIAENLRDSTDFDRVLVYRFASDWHGEVIAEALNEQNPLNSSFMEHHFPASDIPLPARDLFIKNWVRMISDVQAEPIPVLGGGDEIEPLHLTRSILRSPSPIHIEYLKNMNVGASLTLSLLHEGRLWGLIACHHFSPKYLSAEERSVCSLIAKLASTRISSFATADAIAATTRVSTFTNELLDKLSSSQLTDCIKAKKEILRSFVHSDGFAFVSDEECIVEGTVPSKEDLTRLRARLNESDLDVFYTDSLIHEFSELNDLAPDTVGLLAINLENSWLLWIRKEVPISRLWAGDPSKKAYGIQTDKLTPRTSFKAWKEEVKNTSEHWESGDLLAASQLRVELLRTLDGTRRVTPTELSAESRKLLDSITLQTSDLMKSRRGFKFDDAVDGIVSPESP